MKTMKSIWFFAVGLMMTFVFCACSSDSEPEQLPPPEPPVVEEPDELEFRVLVYVDEASVKGHLGGSERRVKSEMDILFSKTSNFFNGGSKEMKYKNNYKVTG